MDYHNLEDAQLVRHYIEGDENSLGELINRHKSKVFGFIYQQVRCRALAEDLFQDAFIRVIRTLKSDSYNEEGKFLPWVMRIANNLILDHYRALARKKVLMVDDGEYDFFDRFYSPEHNSEEKMLAGQHRHKLRKSIYKLPREVRQVVIMRTYFDMSFKEIADLTQVPINTALGRMRNGVIKLRQLLESEN